MNKKWFYKAQVLFKEWKKSANVDSLYHSQRISNNQLIEVTSIYPKSGGAPIACELRATRVPFECYILVDGKEINLLPKKPIAK
jgi:hypothetical protein